MKSSLSQSRLSRKRLSQATPVATNLAVNVTQAFEEGWSFTPLHGKKPRFKGWQERGRASLTEVLEWARQGNIGLRTGVASGGIVVIDVDKGGNADALDLPETVTVVTGSGARHYYFRHDEPVRNSQGKLGEHIDVKADGGQVVFPGSIHPDTKKEYRWLKGHAPWELEIAPLPKRIVTMLNAPPDRPIETAENGVEIPEGQRNSALSRLAGSMRRQGASGDTILTALNCENERRCKPSLPCDEVRTIAQSVARYKPADDDSITFAPLTLAELMTKNISVEYLIRRILAEGQPLLLAGPVKSMKTSIMLDLCLSLATGTPFLDFFEVERKIMVGVFSGESGMPTIGETLRRIARRRRIDPNDVDTLILSDHVPRLSNTSHLDAISGLIIKHDLKLVAIDPAYLALDGTEASNLMIVGQQLRAISDLCQDHGVVLLLCHHTKKGSGNDFQPLQLTDAAWAGFAEHCRQWILINHRERYDHATAIHHLWMSVGGSSGHGGLYAVDIDQHRNDRTGNRRWHVTVATPDEAKLASVDRRAEKQLQEDSKKIIQAMIDLEEERPDGNSITGISKKTNLKTDRLKKALEVLAEKGNVEECQIICSNHKKLISGYKLVKNDDQ